MTDIEAEKELERDKEREQQRQLEAELAKFEHETLAFQKRVRIQIFFKNGT